MNRSLNSLSILGLAATVAIGAITSASAAGPVLVTNGNDNGEGSLRAALDADGPGHVLVVTDDDIKIDTTLTYEGTAPLAIYGKGQTVETGSDITLLTLNQTENNDDGDKSGLEVVQDGKGTLTIRAFEIADGIDAENVDVIEE